MSLTPQTSAAIGSAPYPSWVQQVSGGLLVEACSFTTGIHVTANDVTFSGCQFTVSDTGTGSSAMLLQGTNTTVQYCTIAPVTGVGYSVQYAINVDGGSGLTVDHCNLSGWQNAISNTTTMTITNNYIHDPRYAGAAHMDCIICLAGVSGVTISNNTMLNPLTQSGVIALYNESPFGTYNNVTVTGNLLAGAGYTMYCGTEGGYSCTNMAVSGNYFSTLYYPNCGYYGTHTYSPTWGSAGNVWSGNYWYDGPDAGQLISG